MSDPTDDEDELNGAENAGGEDSGDGKTGKAGGGAGAPRFFLTEEEEEAIRRKRRDEGEGDQDSFGRGKAGAASGVKISPQKLKEVMADWRHLDFNAAVAAVAEFFGDMPMRASANLAVAWEKTKTNVKSFAIVNWLMSFGEKAANDPSLKPAQGRDSRGLQQRTKKSPVGMNMIPGPTGPNGQ